MTLVVASMDMVCCSVSYITDADEEQDGRTVEGLQTKMNVMIQKLSTPLDRR
jgi:hypothetical protein